MLCLVVVSVGCSESGTEKVYHWELVDTTRAENIGTMDSDANFRKNDVLHLGDDVYTVVGVVHFAPRLSDGEWEMGTHKKAILKFIGKATKGNQNESK
ncbi:MAG: hypothetical protein LBN19_03605 [Endomicrobium sp.]|jgi:hypothetical protein|nr:hypothetical protein [Endomicrobium sp.]